MPGRRRRERLPRFREVSELPCEPIRVSPRTAAGLVRRALAVEVSAVGAGCGLLVRVSRAAALRAVRMARRGVLVSRMPFGEEGALVLG